MNELERHAEHLLRVLDQGRDEMQSMGVIPPKALENHLVILGITGSGKTYCAKGTVESLLSQKKRVCVLDPTGVWWGLRSDATGKKPAFPIFVFGGDHGDLPLDSHAGKAIAEIIATTDTSAVLDMRNMTVGERTRFFTDFAETLPRLNKSPLHVIIDEAHRFMPQGRVNDPQSGKMVNAGNDLLSGGRTAGLRIIMITQRPAKLHKDSLTCAETLIALRLIAPQDVEAAKAWIGEWANPKEAKDLIRSLPSLTTGHGWIWAPVLGLLEQVTFPRISTYDSSKSPDGASRQIVLAPIDLPAIEQRLQVVAKEVIENDPKKLRARIAELERRKEPAVEIEKPVIQDWEFDRLEACLRDLKETRTEIDGIIGKAAYVLGHRPIPAEVQHRPMIELPGLRRELRPLPPALIDSPEVLKKTFATDGVGKSGVRRMLVALAQNPEGLSDSKLGLRADVSVKGGSFDTYLSKGKKSGWIEGDRSCLHITKEGLTALGPFDALPTGRRLLDFWLAKLGTGGASRMLDVLSRMYPRTLTAAELGDHAGVSVDGGSFDTYLSRLRGFDLISGSRSALLASEEFFK